MVDISDTLVGFLLPVPAQRGILIFYCLIYKLIELAISGHVDNNNRHRAFLDSY